MSGTADAGPSALLPCPSCGLADRVAAVPAVYHAGRSSIRVTTPAGFGETAQTSARSATTSLAAALAPAPQILPPVLRALAGVFLLLVSVGTLIAQAVGESWFGAGDAPDGNAYPYPLASSPLTPYPLVADPPPDLSFLGWTSACTGLAAIALLTWAGIHRSARRRLLAGRPAAEQVWSQGWYCARCATVHLRAGRNERTRVMTLRDFRELVWEAGGYGHLADRHSLFT